MQYTQQYINCQIQLSSDALLYGCSEIIVASFMCSHKDISIFGMLIPEIGIHAAFVTTRAYHFPLGRLSGKAVYKPTSARKAANEWFQLGCPERKIYDISPFK